ncbi:MAG: citryl-CoA lyase [Gammaproteobacteria bacterium]
MGKGVKLSEYEDKLVTRMGAWFPGERVVFRGLDLHQDFADAEWMDLYVYSFTGRRYTKPQLEMLHTLWVFTSYPDPRLWNNRAAALAGTARSTGALGLSAALAVSDASIYGGRPCIKSIDFLVRTKKAVDNGVDLIDCIRSELRENHSVAGYGRPITGADERVPHLMKRAKHLGFDGGMFVKLAFDIEQILLEGRWRMRMNFAAITAAICADMGFSPRQFYLFAFPAFLAGMIPCFIEATEKPEGSLLPLRCARIDYEGPARRSWD